MPTDSSQLRDDLIACLPSLIIECPMAESGQRVVYLAHFDDSKIPPDITPPEEIDPDEKLFLRGWDAWNKVVVKVVSGVDATTLARLQTETSILQEVRPSSFPRLLYCNLFTENPVTDERLSERLYVSIEEFIESEPLSNLMDQYKDQEQRTVALAIGIANALLPLWIHHRGFVHRDIKPANLLIKPTGEVVVIDLGIVRETGAAGVTRTGWGLAPFTPGYAAPEQIANDKDAINFKTDFFSIGVLMYHLMSGTPPFAYKLNMDIHELALAASTHTPKRLTEVSSSTTECSDFVSKAMMKAPWQRHRTPTQFIDELKQLLKQ